MPEGPEVTFTADQLRERLKGKFILNSWISPQARYKNLELLEYPCQITEILSYGKRLIFSLKSANNEFRMISFLGMTGCWSFEKPANHMHFEFKVGSSPVTGGPFLIQDSSFYYSDQRHFGMLTLILNQYEYNEYFKKTGPDLLVTREQITPELWRSKIRNPRLKEKEICWFLMKQEYFSGIGNYLKSEILYQCRIHPQRKLKDLSDAEVENLRVTALRTIYESYISKGLTISNYRAPNGETGKYACKVYGLVTDIHGYTVQRQNFSDKRTSHFVAEIQR